MIKSHQDYELLHELRDRGYVIIMWTAADIQVLRPDWTDEQCEHALQRIGPRLTDRSIEFGWDVASDLLLYNFPSEDPPT